MKKRSLRRSMRDNSKRKRRAPQTGSPWDLALDQAHLLQRSRDQEPRVNPENDGWETPVMRRKTLLILTCNMSIVVDDPFNRNSGVRDPVR
jgi:hypothetical protein